MKGKSIQLFEQDADRGVSPVIGVILMVAITVILAAVIGTFVLGLGEQVGQTAPQASIGVSDASHNWDSGTTGLQDFVQIKHNGGEDITISDTKVLIRDADSNTLIASWDGTSGTGDHANITGVDAELNGGTYSGDVTTGDVATFRLNPDGTASAPGDGEYRIVIVDKASGQQIASQTVEVS